MDSADTRERDPGHNVSCYAFGGFVLDPLRRCVWDSDGARVALAPRAFSTLLLLVQHAGELLLKDRLLETLWPGMVVDENNLSQVISALRSALGDRGRQYIQTEARRGFRFVCPVVVRPASLASALRPAWEEEARTGPGTALRGPPRLAVLPFTNLDDDPAQDYFVSGMMEEIVAGLTRIRSLLVIGSSTTAALAGNDLLPERAVRRLGVRYILGGSVRRAGRKVRVTVNLIDGIDNAQVWTERFEESLEDVFGLQDRVALGVAGAIEPSIKDMELRRIARLPPDSLDCYDLYLRAAHLRARMRKDTAHEALALLERALALDPDYAPALAQAAGCHSQILAGGWAVDAEHHRRIGRELAERAVRNCGDDAAVLAQVANALMDIEPEPGSNIDQAQALIARATELNPGSAFAWFISGVLQLVDGDGGTAINHLQRAISLDPVSPLRGLAQSHLGAGLAVQGNHQEAVHMLRAASTLTARTRLTLACLSCEIGELHEARAELQRYQQMTALPAETMVLRMTRQQELRNLFLRALSRIRAAD